jgi:hypothetical protein
MKSAERKPFLFVFNHALVFLSRKLCISLSRWNWIAVHLWLLICLINQLVGLLHSFAIITIPCTVHCRKQSFSAFTTGSTGSLANINKCLVKPDRILARAQRKMKTIGVLFWEKSIEQKRTKRCHDLRIIGPGKNHMFNPAVSYDQTCLTFTNHWYFLIFLLLLVFHKKIMPWIAKERGNWRTRCWDRILYGNNDVDEKKIYNWLNCSDLLLHSLWCGCENFASHIYAVYSPIGCNIRCHALLDIQMENTLLFQRPVAEIYCVLLPIPYLHLQSRKGLANTTNSFKWKKDSSLPCDTCRTHMWMHTVGNKVKNLSRIGRQVRTDRLTGCRALLVRRGGSAYIFHWGIGNGLV